MYKKNNFKKTRNQDVRNKGFQQGSKSQGPWRAKNRRKFGEKISHERYISKASDHKHIPDYIPENTFHDLGLEEKLLNNILSMGYVNPTKVQDQAIPHILNGKDLLGLAKTGSGKTGAFLIPIINKAVKDINTRVLIVGPTRELAHQIFAEFKKFTDGYKLKIALVTGGSNIYDQIRILRQDPHFVVATPGRLLDVEKRGIIKLDRFNNVILDEVDQMLAMGFVEDIKAVIERIGSDRQSLFFSATLGKKEEEIAHSLLVEPVTVKSDDQSAIKHVNQEVIKVRSKSHKMEVLEDLLKNKEYKKVLIFSGTKANADTICDDLRNKGFKIDALHGDKRQVVRSKILARFRRHETNILVATDVAARGLDIPDITHVINFDEPAVFSDYIHRVGRTGRVGKPGSAVTFVVGR